ncbi:MAG: protoporphyrinogen oxidase [Puniceicoccales bacterium]|nr:protoporphyrinogen oxidase [Puniceicoccales bacterium]
MPDAKVDAIIIGAGPAGLSAAARLLQGGAEPLVLDNAPRTGGSLLSLRENGFLAEGGPNSLMLENDGAEAFLRSLGVVPLEALPAAKKRFLVCGGKPVAAPSGPLGAITTPLLSLRGKLRVLLEPFAAKAPAGDADESAGAFARRRLGAEVAARLVDPMVSGIYAGDVERLSLRSAFPRLREMELRYGSLLRAGLAKGRAAPVRRLVNFAGGMAEITDAAARFLGDGRLRLSANLRSVEHDAAAGVWRVEWASDGKVFRAAAPTLVFAAPPQSWAQMPLPAALAEMLAPWKTLEAPPLSVVSLGYERGQVAHPLDGFGLLAPGGEKRKILGALFQSSLFPGRAPEGCVLVTSFVGGCRAPALGRLPAEEQVALVRDELRELLGAEGAPVFAKATHWPRAIPQYNVGYEALRERLASAETHFAGLRFCGNYCAGVALPKTILHAVKTAEKILGA